MTSVSVRDLRNRGGDVIERVLHGESLTVTRDGTAVAELRPLRPAPVSTAELVRRRRHLPDVDPEALRSDIDSVIDQRW
ncbi:type II toxin-antitoxin system Phd/YefM family antitoxin [Nakamurella leprariae]|uniref:Type II toxin-antitoxin system prevent-host-death family antitoxin n=1 Tax=Nakamurella leprariae TaxID=2803911 RepID=A0A938YKD6_9ACTN|nr:type II toxin-antitoxin system prevent-host-death family antitoxin [Nakamurella leprariae]MBM9469385.1 type II toxin-antitoxin system prevent-host-death family antitoxin [Nakamurella leprariae]